MIYALYINDALSGQFHDEKTARAYVPDYDDADIRIIEEDHPDVLAKVALRLDEEQAEQAKRQQIRDLVQRLEEGTATSRQVQKALAHVIRKAI